MKAYICDQCGKQAELEKGLGYDAPPKGWLTLSERGNHLYRNRDLCSPVCLLIVTGQLQDERAAQAEQEQVPV